MFYATRVRDARGSYFNLLNGYEQLGWGTVNKVGMGDNPIEGERGDSQSLRLFHQRKEACSAT